MTEYTLTQCSALRGTGVGSHLAWVLQYWNQHGQRKLRNSFPRRLRWSDVSELLTYDSPSYATSSLSVHLYVFFPMQPHPVRL